jgi:hypothetical protein
MISSSRPPADHFLNDVHRRLSRTEGLEPPSHAHGFERGEALRTLARFDQGGDSSANDVDVGGGTLCDQL